MKTSKKILSVLLAVLMAFTALPAAAYAFAAPAGTKASDYTPTYTGNATRGTYAGILQDADELLAQNVFTGATLETLWALVPDMASPVLPAAATAAFYEAADPEVFKNLADYMQSVGAETVTSALLSGTTDEDGSVVTEGYFDSYPITVENGEAFAEHADRFIDAFLTPETTQMIAAALTGNLQPDAVASLCAHLDGLCTALGIAQPLGLHSVLENAAAGADGADYQLRVYLKNVLFFFVPHTAEGLMNMLRAIAEPANSALFYESVKGLVNEDLDVILSAVGGVTPDMQAQIDEIKEIINKLPTTKVTVDGEEKDIFDINGVLDYVINDVIYPQVLASLDGKTQTAVKIFVSLAGGLISFDGSGAVIKFETIDLTQLTKADDAVDTLNMVLHYLYVNIKANDGILTLINMFGGELPSYVQAILDAVMDENGTEANTVWVIYQQLHMLTTGSETAPTTPPAEPAATPSYTVTATAGAGGSVAPASQSVVSGRDTFVYVTADEGYVIDQLTIGGETVAAAAGKTAYTAQLQDVSAATQVAVTFKSTEEPVKEYTVTVTKDGQGTAAADKTTVKDGEDVVVTIAPADGWQLAKVTVDGADKTADVKDGKLTITGVTANVNVAVTFTEIPQQSFTVTATAGQGGTVDPETATVGEGESVTLQVKANDGYVIDQITVNGELVADVAGKTSYELSFKDITENKTVNATFKAAEEPVKEYPVTVTKDGQGTAEADKETVKDGEDVVVTIAPAEGWQLAKVTVNGADKTADVKDGKLTITGVTADVAVAVTFEEIPVPEWTVSVTTSGQGTATADKETVKNGEDVVVTITPAAGWQLAKVTADGKDVTADVQNNKLTVTGVTADVAVVVTFAEKPLQQFTVKAEAGQGGTISPSGTWTVQEGTSRAFKVTANSGYVIDQVLVNGQALVGAAGRTEYAITRTIEANTTISVSFKKQEVRRKAQVMVSSLNVRSSASSSSASVVKLVKNNLAYIDGESGNWYLVSFTKGGKQYSGYLPKQYVKIIAGTPKDKGAVIAKSANVYTSTAANKVETTLDRDLLVYIDGEAGDYYLVSFSWNGWHYGYVKKDYVRDASLPTDYKSVYSSHQATVMTSEVIVCDADGNPVTVLYKNNKVYINEVLDNGQYKVSFTQYGESFEGYVGKQYFRISSGAAKEKGAVIAKSANVYTSTAATKVESTLSRKLLVYIDQEVGDYYLVSFSWNGWHYGYILKDYVRDAGLPANYKSVYSSHQALVMTDEVIVRDADGNPVTVLYENNKVYINEVLDDGRYKVSFTQYGEPFDGYVGKQYFRISSGAAKPAGTITADVATIYTDTDKTSVESTLRKGLRVYIDKEEGDYYLVSFSWDGWHYGYIDKADVNA